MEIIINKKVKISNNQRPLIVAEISANHCGNKKKFISHIKKAASSGADLIKIMNVSNFIQQIYPMVKVVLQYKILF